MVAILFIFDYTKYGDTMNIIDIINKKRTKDILTYDELKYAIDGYLKSEIPDYQISALLMAISINGMNIKETVDLTKVIVESGSINDLSAIGNVVDKHSTGGVGDKTTLIIGPIVASLGINIAKMSGRALGHTGGTIDKLESIEGFKTELSKSQFVNQIKKIGIAITSQTNNITPADKKLYSLRDVTATVSSIPLIASSIMSKKIAGGADKILIDVKVGNGALIPDENEARKLAHTMIEIGKYYNKKVICVLTNMNEPLGNSIGNALEIQESIDTLNGKGPKDLNELIVKLSAIIIGMEKDVNAIDAVNMVKESIKKGKAYKKFEDLILSQGGNLKSLKISDNVISIKSVKDGFITNINTLKLGEFARDLGAGRIHKDDVIDHSVGFVLSKKVGDFVTENEELLKVYINEKDVNVNEIIKCFEIGPSFKEKPNLIIDIID